MTDRLRLRPVGDGDADALFAVHSDAYVLRYWDSPPWTERSRADRFVEMSRRMAAEGTGARLAIEHAADGTFLGWCGLTGWNPTYRSAALGYVLAEDAWGHGYATEAARALLTWGFDTLQLNRVQAETDTRNLASARVLEKLGFVREGTLREDCVVAGEVSDSWVFGLLRSDWADPSPAFTRPQPVARRMFGLTEPIALVNFFAPEPDEEMSALGFTNYWDGYSAGRAAPLGRVPAEVVHAAFYSFADGEAARHIPKVWEVTTPEAAHEARGGGGVAALRRILGELVGTPELARAADLLTVAATSAPTEGRVMYAGLRALPVPDEPLPRLWHAANLVREHRGDGHVAALVGERIGGTEAHVLSALAMGIYPAETFGRIHHLPRERLAAVMDGLRVRGLLDADGRLTDEGRATKDRVEARTDELAEAPYEALDVGERDELVELLTPIAARLEAAGSR